MSRPNTSFAEPREPREEATAPEREAAPSPLPSGVELLIGQISEALADGQVACTMLQAAKASGDSRAIQSAAHALFIALSSDPKALARKVALMVKS